MLMRSGKWPTLVAILSVGVLAVLAGGTGEVTAAASGPSASAVSGNAPWYPSLAAFEHHDSGRTHLFPTARFGGSFSGRNKVTVTASPDKYPRAGTSRI